MKKYVVERSNYVSLNLKEISEKKKFLNVFEPSTKRLYQYGSWEKISWNNGIIQTHRPQNNQRNSLKNIYSPIKMILNRAVRN